MEETMPFMCAHCGIQVIGDKEWEAHQNSEEHRARMPNAITLTLSQEHAKTVLSALKWVMQNGEQAMQWDVQSIAKVTHVVVELEGKVTAEKIDAA
jgi:hypothetical protein